jgi:hypothetical protein
MYPVLSSRAFTRLVLPAPEGAEKINSVPVNVLAMLIQ